MIVTIDPKAGFCFGVVKTIQIAEEELKKRGKLYCLGNIVHNKMEVDRLKKLGMLFIDHEDFKKLRNTIVLIRSHGEPPETYKIAKQNNIQLIDGTCPVVKKLQYRIRAQFEDVREPDGQIVIFGKEKHPEVIGLSGQTKNKAIVITGENDLGKIDYTMPVHLFAQTTQSLSLFQNITKKIIQKYEETEKPANRKPVVNDTICRQVSNREPVLMEFAKTHDLILFVSGKHSSNGQFLFEVCKSVNPRTYKISTPKEIQMTWFDGISSVGVSGATSTPGWLLENVSDVIKKI